jgi:UDP-GlcNAc:undecaprenyl-phosphate GlcNAc-1-phosphate transferase
MTMMTELALLFFLSLGLSLVLTPAVRVLGIRCGALDYPGERKVHDTPIPRIGGLAVFLAFTITAIFANAFLPYVGGLYECNFNTFMGHAGGVLILLCGLYDDCRHLNAWVKLFFQILAATLAFVGGATISGIYISGHGWSFGPVMTYLVTVFWFLLFINAMNLVDGLDGLAGGLVCFTCAIMSFSTYFHGEYLSTFYFVIVAGSVLGFLRYNFNPANIFLGDGGSYFLGYVIAILAIRSSSKSHVGVLMVMPLVAMGVPIFDAIFSPVRRFIIGRSPFQPDKEHIHHALLKMGLTTRKAVLAIYGVTLGLCAVAIAMMFLRGRGVDSFLMAALLLGMIVVVRKLGYIEYLAFDKLQGWFDDVTDVAGISRHRRSFLARQIELGKAQNHEEMGKAFEKAVDMLRFDEARLYGQEGSIVRAWKRECPDLEEAGETQNLMRLEIPLKSQNGKHLGKVVLIKDMQKGGLQRFTIRRVEHLRRTLVGTLERLSGTL